MSFSKQVRPATLRSGAPEPSLTLGTEVGDMAAAMPKTRNYKYHLEHDFSVDSQRFSFSPSGTT